MRLSGTAMKFEYPRLETSVTSRQVTQLLEGLGYDQVIVVHDDIAEVMVVCAVRFFGEPVKDKTHEVNAIWGILGRKVDIQFYSLRPTRKMSYTPTATCHLMRLT